MRLILILLLLFLTATAPGLAQTDDKSEGAVKESQVESSEPSKADADVSKVSNKDYYFLVVQGKGMPVKEISINGINVLGGSVISLSMPINVTREIRLGLNEIKVRYISHSTEELVTIMEKRTSGPKRQEIIRVVLQPNESQGQELTKDIAFNVDPAPNPPDKIELSDDDRNAILKLVSEYYAALNSKNAAKLRALYNPALKEEQHIFPEGADFFSKILEKEIALLKKKEIKMSGFAVEDVMLEQEHDKIRCVRKDRQPMMESNEIEVVVEPFLSEVNDEPSKKGKTKGDNARKDKAKSKAKSPPPATKKENLAKQRLVTTMLLFKRIDGHWRLALPRGV